MKEIYIKAKVCPYKQIDANCNLNLDSKFFQMREREREHCTYLFIYFNYL